MTVILWARSAHTLPRTTVLSHRVKWATRSAFLAARNRATFSSAVSAIVCGFDCGGGEEGVALDLEDSRGEDRNLGGVEAERVVGEGRIDEGLE